VHACMHACVCVCVCVKHFEQCAKITSIFHEDIYIYSELYMLQLLRNILRSTFVALSTFSAPLRREPETERLLNQR